MADRIHIGQFTNFYHPIVNGVVHSVSIYRKALTKLGHNVFVFAQQSTDYEDQEPFIFRYPSVNIPSQSDLSAAIPISRTIDKVLPVLKLDVIHTHHPFLLGQVAANKSEELDIPLVFTFHTRYRDYTHYFPLPQEFVQEFIKTAIDSWMADFMERCHHVIVPSQSMLEILQKGYGLGDQATVLPTGIDLEPYKKADGKEARKKMGWGDDIVLISIGRLAEEKNMTLLIEAAARVISVQPTVRFVLVGDGPDRESLENFAEELNISDRVNFLGKLPFEDIPALLKAADIFCFASVTETQGMVTMEALAAGLPVAAVDASGTRDVITGGEDGLLTENTSEALASAILAIIEDPAMAQSFRDAAESKAQTFEVSFLTGKLVDIYQEAISDHAAGKTLRLEKPKLLQIDWKLFPSLADE